MPTIIAARDNAPRSLNTNSYLTVGRRTLKRFIDLENGVWGETMTAVATTMKRSVDECCNACSCVHL